MARAPPPERARPTAGPVLIESSIRLLVFRTGCSGCPERRGVADRFLPLGGFEGVAALSFWTPWPLIEICAWSLFMEMPAGRPRGRAAKTGGQTEWRSA